MADDYRPDPSNYVMKGNKPKPIVTPIIEASAFEAIDSLTQDQMRVLLKRGHGLPEPADIATIIERGNKPPFDKAVYVSISKKDMADRKSHEWQYMKDYERFIVTGKN